MWHSIKISIYWIFYFFELDTIYRYMVPHDMYIYHLTFWLMRYHEKHSNDTQLHRMWLKPFLKAILSLCVVQNTSWMLTCKWPQHRKRSGGHDENNICKELWVNKISLLYDTKFRVAFNANESWLVHNIQNTFG